MGKVFLCLVIILILLILTKPSNDSFNEWLSDKHKYDCQEKECIHNSESSKIIEGKKEKVVYRDIEKVVHRDTEDYFFFNKMSIKLEDEEGRLFLIEGTGILGGFITLTYKPVFE